MGFADWFRSRFAAPTQTSTVDVPAPLPRTPAPRFDSPRTDEWSMYASHPGDGLRPQRLLSIYREAESGWPARQCDLFEDIIENDAHLRSQVEQRIESVAGQPWIVQAGGDAPEDLEAALALEDALRAIPNMTETLSHQLTANAFGWAATEIVWGRRDGLTVPVWMANVPHRRFIFTKFDEPRLLTKLGDTDGVRLEPGKWIYTAHAGPLGRQTVRAGYMRTACWLAMWKRASLRDWNIYADRFGLPFATGVYDTHANDAERAALRQAVASIGTDRYAIFSEACKIQLTQAESGGRADDVHGALIELCNREISKLVTGSTLMSEAGTQGGSYALARVQQARAFASQYSDANSLGRRFEQDIGRPFVHFNGLAGRPPRLKVHVKPDLDPKTLAEVYEILQRMGLPLDADQVRQEFLVKKPTGESLEPPRATSPTAPPDPA